MNRVSHSSPTKLPDFRKPLLIYYCTYFGTVPHVILHAYEEYTLGIVYIN